MNKIMLKPHKKVVSVQRQVIWWGLLHVFTIVCYVAGIHYCREYMLLPDRVILADQAGNLYRGSSRNVVCRETAEDIARRAALSFLDRSFEHDHQKACEALFGRTAQKSLRDIISKSKDEFSGQMIRQVPVVREIELSPADEPGQCLAFVTGTLYRTGIYMDIPYFQELEFTLGLRLMRSPDLKTYPLRVLRMKYEEKSVYDNKPTEGNTP